VTAGENRLVAGNTGSPETAASVQDRGKESAPFPNNPLLKFLSEVVFLPILGPIFYLWFLTDLLVPKQFRVLRKLVGIPWKGALLFMFSYIVVASLYVDFSHGFWAWIAHMVAGVLGPQPLF